MDIPQIDLSTDQGGGWAEMDPAPTRQEAQMDNIHKISTVKNRYLTYGVFLFIIVLYVTQFIFWYRESIGYLPGIEYFNYMGVRWGAVASFAIVCIVQILFVRAVYAFLEFRIVIMKRAEMNLELSESEEKLVLQQEVSIGSKLVLILLLGIAVTLPDIFIQYQGLIQVFAGTSGSFFDLHPAFMLFFCVILFFLEFGQEIALLSVEGLAQFLLINDFLLSAEELEKLYGTYETVGVSS